MKKTIYLASPYGFSEQQKERLLPEFVRLLELLGAEVWEPFARNNQIDFSQKGWAYRVGQADLKDVVESDAIFAVVNGGGGTAATEIIVSQVKKVRTLIQQISQLMSEFFL